LEPKISEGIIHSINRRRGVVAVQTAAGNFSVFELLGDDPVDIGDKVFWFQATSLGTTLLANITQNRIFEVSFQSHEVPESRLKKQLLID
jgi:hypothetical protein